MDLFHLTELCDVPNIPYHNSNVKRFSNGFINFIETSRDKNQSLKSNIFSRYLQVSTINFIWSSFLPFREKSDLYH